MYLQIVGGVFGKTRDSSLRNTRCCGLDNTDEYTGLQRNPVDMQYAKMLNTYDTNNCRGKVVSRS